MAVAKAQRDGKIQTCRCGCGKTFKCFPVYKPRAEGGGLRYPEYMRGHHPNTKRRRPGESPWNKGLTKEECPTLARMGFQPGHKPYNNWDHVNRKLREDQELRRRWLAAKRGQVPWNKGKTRDEYRNGIKTGPDHGNWKGGRRGAVDTAEWARLRRKAWKRDKYTCQHCGDKNRKGRGKRIRLHAHHIVAIKHAPHLALSLENLVTLCEPCHRRTENYGTKALRKK